MSIKYKTIEPPNHLKNMVKNYFVMEGESKTYNMFHFADFNAKLLFIKDGLVGHCKSNNIKKHNQYNGRVIRTNTDIITNRHTAVLLGPNYDYCVIRFEGRIDIIGVELQPTGIWYLTNRNAYLYTDTLSHISDIDVPGITQLINSVIQGNTQESILTEISTFLSQKELISIKDYENIQKINKIINQTNPLDKINDIAYNMGISEKQLQRLYKRYIGITPIHFMLITRFKNVLRMLSEYKESKELNKIADDKKYYDISHLCKDTKHLAGHSPYVLQETGNIIKLVENMAIVYEDDNECTFCIYSH